MSHHPPREGDPFPADDRLFGQSGATYRVDERIGIGGTSQVYRVRDTAGRAYAAKLLSGHRFPITEQMRLRFTREVNLLAAICHPNVVSFVDTGKYDGGPFLVMELAEMSLHELLRRDRKLERISALSILLGALTGAAAIHDAGMVHRDLAPRNILLTFDGRVVIGDFGTVRNLADATITGDAALGSLIYISRDQFENPHAAKPSDDVFQLGQVAYELLSGIRPVGNPPPLETFISSLDGLVRRMRNGRRVERFPSAREARDGLLGIVDAMTLANARYGVELADRIAALHAVRQANSLKSVNHRGRPETIDLLTRLVRRLGALDLDLSALFELPRSEWNESANGDWVPSTAGANRLLVGGSLMWEAYIGHTDGRELRDECAVTNSATGRSVVIASSRESGSWPEIRKALDHLLRLPDSQLREFLAPLNRKGWLYGSRCTDCGESLRVQVDRKSGALHRGSVCPSEPPASRHRCPVCGDALEETTASPLGPVVTCGCQDLAFAHPLNAPWNVRPLEEEDVPSLFFRYQTGRPKLRWD